jgi:uncharacterized protein YqgC (DUF456 family)
MAIAMLADSMSQKSSCDKFMGERFCERIGTLGGASRPVIGVITLRSYGVLVVSSVSIIVCDLVWYRFCAGEVKIGWDKSAGLLFSAILAGAFESPGV